MTRVDGTTQVYAVLGDPVDHSLSPRIQNAAFAALGIDAVYVPLRVPAQALGGVLHALHGAGVRGLNLTTPHKESAFALAQDSDRGWSEISEEARRSRAINTLRWESNGWTGHATDGIGFMKWVEESGVAWDGKRILILGAGGAARTIVMGLIAESPQSIHIVNRRKEHADQLARMAWDAPFRSASSAAMSSTEEPKRWDVVVRALSTENVSEDELRWWRGCERGAILFDLNYGPRSEIARGLAEEHGFRYRDGGELLVHQGAESFRFWTGREAPIEVMREALIAG